MSVRLKLTLSYAGVVLVSGALLLAVVWVFLLRYVPEVINFVEPDWPPGREPGRGPGHVPNRSDLVRAFAPRVAVALGFLLVFGLLGGWILAGRMLAPLRRITDATRLATDGSLSHRIELEGPGDEFRELADAFDAMLTRLESHVAEQQRFAANASHELRTPLATSQAMLEVARDDPDADRTELIARLQTVNSRAIELTEALLLLSRADQRGFTREFVDLSLLVEDAVETLLPLAEDRGVVIETAAPLATTNGSAALLLQLTTNLVHNAIVHNLADGGRVWISTLPGGDGAASGTVALTVENTGELVSQHRVATLTEPFQRGTERIRDDQAGVGLGLAIAKSITRAHDGDLTVVARPEGGIRVTVRLPAARAIPLEFKI